MHKLTAGPFWFADLTQALSEGLDPDHLERVRQILTGHSKPEKWRHDHDLSPPLRGWRSIRVAIRADVTRHPAFRRWLARLDVPEQK